LSQNATDPDFNVYTIITRFTTSESRNGEARAVALSNTEIGEVIDAHAVGGSDILLTGGPPEEATALRTGTLGSNTTIQWDSDHVKTVAAQTQNASNVVCFCKGTYIDTPLGAQNISDLRVCSGSCRGAWPACARMRSLQFTATSTAHSAKRFKLRYH